MPLGSAETRPERPARAVERRRLRREVGLLRTRLGQELPSRELVGGSPAMERLRRTAVQVAPSDTPVLIEGETGTGKEIVAATLHRLSARAGPDE